MTARLAVLVIGAFWMGTASDVARSIDEPVPAVPERAPSFEFDAHLWRLVLSADAGAQQDGMAEMRRGLGAMRAGDAIGATAAFERAAELAPGLADWAHLFAAEAAAERGDILRVRESLERTDDWLARERGWKAETRALRKAGDLDRAAGRARAAGRTLESPTRRSEALRTAAEIELILGDTASALDALRVAIAEAPMSTEALDAARMFSVLPRLSAEDHREIGRLYFRHGNAPRGIAGIDRYLASGRGTPEERAIARLDLARGLFATERYTEAERRLGTITKEKTTPTLDAEALLLLGRVQYRRNRTTAARATLRDVAERYSEERAAAEALYILADLDHDAGRIDEAREGYRRAIAASPRSDEAGQAALRLGGLELVAGRAAHAAVIFEEFRAFHAGGRRHPQASFWAARAHLDRKDTLRAYPLLREVIRLDAASYYGLRAAQLLGTRWIDALAPPRMTSPQSTREAAGAVARLDRLAELGVQSAFDLEVERIKHTFRDRTDALYAVAEAFSERGQVLAAVRLGREIQRVEGTWNERLLRIVYPFPYRDEIVAQALSRGLDPFLVAGLIRQESLFDPAARSSAGALGLMQVMPRTGRSLAGRAGIGNFQTAHLSRPETNLRLGTLFFADLMAQYGGHSSYALAAYNAGPSRVARWRDLPEAVDPDLFAERIPFAETRDYVKVVQQNAYIYGMLYRE